MGGAGAGMSDKEREKALAVTFALVLCGPCFVVCIPICTCCRYAFDFSLGPLLKCVASCFSLICQVTCRPICNICGFPSVTLGCLGLLEGCGCISFDGISGRVSCRNPCSLEGCCGFALSACCGANGFVKCFAQATLAPGCLVPGRSLMATFINSAAMLWFFLYLLFILWSSWEVTCPQYDPGVDFNDAPWTWMLHGAPTPIHWLLLIFTITGMFIVICSFLIDMFTGPKPPPRSFYEATLWRGRRQLKVIGYVLLLLLFLAWGIALIYFTFNDDGCASQGGGAGGGGGGGLYGGGLNSLYNIACLLVLLLVVTFGLISFLGCCVLLDCFLSGRVRFILLLQAGQPPMPPPPEQYGSADLIAQGDERLVPGVPPRDLGEKFHFPNVHLPDIHLNLPNVHLPNVHLPNIGLLSAPGAFLVGAVDDSGSRLCVDGDVSSAPPAQWASPGAKLPNASK